MKIPKLEKVLSSILKQNTGRSMLDSGDYYGRHYERNQHINFEKEDSVSCEFDVFGRNDERLEVSVSYNLYHYLKHFLSYDRETYLLNKFFQICYNAVYEQSEVFINEMTFFFNEIAWNTGIEALDRNKESDLEVLSFLEEQGYASKNEDGEIILNNLDFSFSFYFENNEPYPEYTYNRENCLSQNIIYDFFSINRNNSYAIISVHNGCDARGGFTFPVIFHISETDSFALYMSDVRLTSSYSSSIKENKNNLELFPLKDFIVIEDFYVDWISDDAGYSFYLEHSLDEKDLLKKLGREFQFKRKLSDYPIVVIGEDIAEEDFPEDLGKAFTGIVYFVEETKQAYCPITGGLLECLPVF